MEKFESFIIKLSKRKKQDFAKHFRKSIARDFQIKWKGILPADQISPGKRPHSLLFYVCFSCYSPSSCLSLSFPLPVSLLEILIASGSAPKQSVKDEKALKKRKAAPEEEDEVEEEQPDSPSLSLSLSLSLLSLLLFLTQTALQQSAPEPKQTAKKSPPKVAPAPAAAASSSSAKATTSKHFKK
jgi:hypothetical protein